MKESSLGGLINRAEEGEVLPSTIRINPANGNAKARLEKKREHLVSLRAGNAGTFTDKDNYIIDFLNLLIKNSWIRFDADTLKVVSGKLNGKFQESLAREAYIAIGNYPYLVTKE